MENPDSDADLVEADGDRANDNVTGPNKKVAVMKPPAYTAKRVKKRRVGVDKRNTFGNE